MVLLSHKKDPLPYCFSFMELCDWKTPFLVLVLLFALGSTDLGVKMALLSYNESPVAILSV